MSQTNYPCGTSRYILSTSSQAGPKSTVPKLVYGAWWATLAQPADQAAIMLVATRNSQARSIHRCHGAGYLERLQGTCWQAGRLCDCWRPWVLQAASSDHTYTIIASTVTQRALRARPRQHLWRAHFQTSFEFGQVFAPCFSVGRYL
jgi:hypothetical protein